MQKITPPLKKAFTLIELLVVILIISLIYGLALSYYIPSQKDDENILTVEKLKEQLQSKYQHKQLTLLCTNSCQECYIKVDDKFTKYNNKTKLRDVIAYNIDSQNQLRKIDYGKYNGQNICLIFNIYSNGSSSQLITTQNNKNYLLPAFGMSPIATSSVETAKDIWLHNSYLVSKDGAFY